MSHLDQSHILIRHRRNKVYLLSAFSTGTTKIIVIDFTSLKKRWPFICLDKPKCLLTIFSDLSLSWQLVCDRWSWVISWLLWKLKPCTRCSLVLNYHLWYMGFVMKASAFWIFLSFFQDNEQKKKNAQACFFIGRDISEFTELALLAFLFSVFLETFPW